MSIKDDVKRAQKVRPPGEEKAPEKPTVTKRREQAIRETPGKGGR